MSRRAWAYIWGMLLLAALTSALSFSGLAAASSHDWLTFAVLSILTTLSLIYWVEGPHHLEYSVNFVFIFVGVLLLPTPLYVLLAIVPGLVGWLYLRLTEHGKPLHLRAWYIQPFNIAVDIVGGLASRQIYLALGLYLGSGSHLAELLVAVCTAVSFVLLNHFFVGQAVVLAREKSWRETGMLDPENIVTDLVLTFMGAVVAVLWLDNPWLIVPALSPLVLIYRALRIPLLEQEAQTDVKTGLWNARYFTRLLEGEVDRASRFSRPMAVIVADLDLLRNINNTYGHLAGDIVLVGIGQLIRKTIREYDIASRFGGEEFCIAMPESGPEEARALAERLRTVIESASFVVETSPTPLHVTMSFGVACFPQDGETPSALIHEADVAVYQAKFTGRNRVVCASDVPHSMKLEQGQPGTRALAAGDQGDASAPAQSPPPRPTRSAPAALTLGARPEPSSSWHRFRPSLLAFMALVILAGVALSALGLAMHPRHDVIAMVLLAILAGLTELFQLNVYGENTISVSAAFAFAASIVSHLPGVAAVSAAIVIADYFRRQPPISRVPFNWAVHVLAGTAPALTIPLLGRHVPIEIANLPLLFLPVAGLALIYYLIETGLIAIALGLSRGASIKAKWRDQFQWLAGHYLVLGILGLFLALAYDGLGPSGVVAFVLPVVMMRYTQKQYVERTQDSAQELKRMNVELSTANHQIISASAAISQLNDELFLTLAKIIDARDPYVGGHSAKVADYATTMARELGLAPERVEQVRQAALLHDIGKIGISENVLHKQSRLTRQEFEYVKTHVTIGAELLETSQGLRHLVPFVRHHHERWDGGGYPDGLAGEAIPLEARILILCDSVEVMASDRPYHRAMTLPEIRAEVERCSGSQFDPALAELFLRVLAREGERLIVNSAKEVGRKQSENPELAELGARG